MDVVRERFVVSGDLRIRVVEEGESGLPVVVLVHGFPDTSAVWDGVVEGFRGRFRVVRYDTRGAGGSGRPLGGVGGYRVERLVEDLVAVVRDVAPGRKVHLVGHDWGSTQAWEAVAGHPELFESFVSISGPSLGQVADWVARNRWHPVKVLNLLRRSWYIAGFRVPVLPELLWRVRAVRVRLNAQHRELSNGLGLYRANVGSAPAPRKVTVPVLQIALRKDPFVKAGHLEAAEPWVSNLTRRPLHASHWAPRTHPEAVARMIAEFVEGTPARRELVVITGAGSGIGRASALAFAVDGAHVIAVDVDGAAAARTAKEVRGHAYEVDVADGAAVRALAERVRAEHGVPDVVMANAGVVVAGAFLDTSEDDWKRVVDVNLWGVVHTLRAFLPQVVERGEGGHAVVTASMASYFPSKALPAYSTTKAAVLMLAECLAEELAPHGIGVSAICPGIVHTDITRSATFAGASTNEEEAKREAVTRTYQLRGYGPEKVATAVVAAVRHNRLVVPVTPESRLVRFGSRVSPKAVRVLGRLAGPTWRQ